MEKELVSELNKLKQESSKSVKQKGLPQYKNFSLFENLSNSFSNSIKTALFAKYYILNGTMKGCLLNYKSLFPRNLILYH